MKVLHKGFVLVGVPLLLESLIIGSLCLIMFVTDREQAIETQKRNRLLCSARLVFANDDAGIAMLKFWSSFNTKFLDSYDPAMAKARRLLAEFKAMPPDPSPVMQAASERAAKNEDVFLPNIDRLADLSRGGFSLHNVKGAIQLQKELMSTVMDNYGEFRKLHDDTERTLKESGQRLKSLKNLELAVLGIGFLLNIAAAYALLRFFNKQFNSPVATIEQKILLLAQGKHVNRPDAGDDEIAALDRAFYEMSEQVLLSAEREMALFNNSSDAICVLDENEDLVRANPAAQRQWYKTGGEIAGQNLAALVPAADLSRARLCLQQCRQSPSSVNLSRSASERSAYFETGLPQDPQTQLLWSVFWSDTSRSWYCVVYDVTDQKKLEKLKESFLQLIAADFRKPLAHIQALFDKLGSGQFGELPQHAKDKVSAAIRTLSRLVSLVDELLHLEQLQSRESRLDRCEQPAVELINQSVEDVHVVCRARNVNVQIECPTDLLCLADSQQIVRVIINFLSNAVKYSPENGTVRIVAKAESDGVRFEIIDEGAGIPAEILATLFQPFKQASTADGKRGKGTGLGLVICKKIVEQHGGRVGVKSEVGTGSNFWFYLPSTLQLPQTAGPEANAVEPVSKASESLPAARATSFSGGNINLKQKALVLIGVPLFLETLFVGAMFWILVQGSGELSRQIKSRTQLATALDLAMGFEEISFVMRCAEPGKFDRAACDQLMSSVPARIERFKAAVAGDTVLTAGADQIVVQAEKIKRQAPEWLEAVSVKKGQSITMSHIYSGALYNLNHKLVVAVNQLVEYCDRRDIEAPKKLQALRKNEVGLLSLGLLFNFLTAGAMAVFFSKDVAARLAILTQNSRRFSRGEPLHAKVEGADEIAGLDAAFRRMSQELTAARAKERAFLDNSQNIICSLDEQGKFLAVNPAVAEILDVTAAELVGTELWRLTSPEDRDFVEREFAQAAQLGEPVRFEAPLHGGVKSVELAWSVSFSTREKAFFCVARDISQRKEMERLKREFLAVVTHDLRTPLTTISGMTILLLNGAFGAVPEAAVHYLKQITAETDRILNLVNDLLDLEKLEAGQMKLDVAEISLVSLLERSVEMALKALRSGSVLEQSKPLQFSVDAPEVQLNVDSERLVHAFASLLVEATDMLPQSVRIACRQRDEGVDVKLISRGCSASAASIEQFLERIENPSAQSDEAAVSRLRLPLARRIVEAHCGHLKASLDDDGNLLLEVDLPLVV